MVAAMAEPKLCKTCKHSFRLPESAKYLRCHKSVVKAAADGSLCGEMRKGACGPEGTLWEPIDGQA